MTGRGRETECDGERRGGGEWRKGNTNREIQLYSGNIAAESEV